MNRTLSEAIDQLLIAETYAMEPATRTATLLPLFRQRIQEAAAGNKLYARLCRNWPVPLERAQHLSQLPYLPVSLFKRKEPLSCLPAHVKPRIISSSATTGQVPSRIPLDAQTAKLMARGASVILKDFVGGSRRPFIIVDGPQKSSSSALTARGAAIRALMPFATSLQSILKDADNLELDPEAIERVNDTFTDRPVLVYGFTYILWFHLVKAFEHRGLRLHLPKAHVLHSGGWKKLQASAVSKTDFNLGVAGALGCPASNVIDFYGMVENIGVIYPDCAFGNKHVPNFAEVVIRDPLTFAPAGIGEMGVIQVGSLLPSSFPGHMLLTEDMGQVAALDGCQCGRRGLAFRLVGRVPKSEVRGCGNVIAKRHEERAAA